MGRFETIRLILARSQEMSGFGLKDTVKDVNFRFERDFRNPKAAEADVQSEPFSPRQRIIAV